MWEKNIMPLTPHIGEKLRELLQEVGEAAVTYSITAAVEHGARNFSYVQAVAKNYANGNQKPQRLQVAKKNDVAAAAEAVIAAFESE